MDLQKFRALARNWEALGDADPMFGVLSDPAKQHGRWDTHEFFETGRAHVDKLFRTLSSRGVAFERGSCLDFGCGVGRLTLPLSTEFQRTVGVDVARSMVAAARRFLGPADRCDFVVNRHPDLRQFKTGTFDFVHSCLVLQHIPPDVSVSYVREFLRIVKPGGLVVFQLPAERRTEEQVSAMYALPEGGYRAALTLTSAPVRLEAGRATTVQVRTINAGLVSWDHDIPAGRHICLANHWLDAAGHVAVPDDGRARLPHAILPGQGVDIALQIQAPSVPGRYQLEVDLVQERICWFAQRGSRTARVDVEVFEPAVAVAEHIPEPVRPQPVPWLARLRRRLKGGTPTFEMHVVPRATIESLVAASGAVLLHAVDDNAAGEGWLSYTYICRR